MNLFLLPVVAYSLQRKILKAGTGLTPYHWGYFWGYRPFENLENLVFMRVCGHDSNDTLAKY